MLLILMSSLSMPMTLWPRRARQAAVTLPTYPRPNTATVEGEKEFIFIEPELPNAQGHVAWSKAEADTHLADCAVVQGEGIAHILAHRIHSDQVQGLGDL